MYLRDAQGRLRYFPPQAQGFDPFMDNRGPVYSMQQQMIRVHMQQEEWMRFNAPPPGDQMHYQPEQQSQNVAPSPRPAPPMSMGHMIAMQNDQLFFGVDPPPPVMIEPGCLPAHVPSPMGTPTSRSQPRAHQRQVYEETDSAQPSCMNTLFGSQVQSKAKNVSGFMACNVADPPTHANFDIKLPSHFSKFVQPESIKNGDRASPLANPMRVFHCNGVRGAGKRFDYTFQPKMPQCHGGTSFNKVTDKFSGDPPVDEISVHDSFDDQTFIMDMDIVMSPPKKGGGWRKKAPRQKSTLKVKEELKNQDSLEQIREQNSAYESAEEDFLPAHQDMVHPKTTSESEDSKNVTYQEVVATKKRRSKKQRDQTRTVSAGPVIAIASKSPQTVPDETPVQQAKLEEASLQPLTVQAVSKQVELERKKAQLTALASLQAMQQERPERVSPETVAGVSVGAYVEMERKIAQMEALATLQALQQAEVLQHEQREVVIAAYGPPPRSKSHKQKMKIRSHSELVQTAGPSGDHGFTAQDQALLVQSIREICLRATPELDEEYPSFDEPKPKDEGKSKSRRKSKPEGRTSSPELSEVSGCSNGENEQQTANKDKKKKSKKDKKSKKEKEERREKKEKRKKKLARERERVTLSVLEPTN